jgi:hypothetical protein
MVSGLYPYYTPIIPLFYPYFTPIIPLFYPYFTPYSTPNLPLFMKKIGKSVAIMETPPLFKSSEMSAKMTCDPFDM